MTDFKAVIPARYDSVRLPGKPLRQLAGRTMLEHVWRIASKSGAAEVLIATDDQRIHDAAGAIGATAIMTARSHASGSDRISEVAEQRNWSPDTVVVNVQCDEPLLPPLLIEQVAETLSASGDIATLATPMESDAHFHDPNIVKVVIDETGRALYFSRAPVPYHRADPSRPHGMLRHVGIYAYRVSALRRLCALARCELERTERLEQLRALWAGMRIDVAIADAQPGPGVDTEQDLAVVEKLMQQRI
ncbi:MAG: 3-deoxy-manno-octulosonate cytidylyltransferase [Gammaproteobacteria bacterium]|nr:3-deoxy-manno-octulosonate cytidylyltransferase [Gammaproteobacteria bacterium]MDH3767807.1 3-deoxy-manno-octulosonate cytidylyltransferase [Gammaproteobacteria bacterium]